MPTAPVAASPSPSAVEVDRLGVRYGRLDAVAGLSLVAPLGAITAVLGPNGAGKSSTIECCVGLRRPDAGTVRVLGLDPRSRARTLRPLVGVMLQDGGLPSGAPAGQVLAHLASMYARPRSVPELRERLGIDRFARTTVRRLSGGERQRLALAAAVVGRPEVVFLDEPTTGLDPQARHAVWELVGELRAGGTSIVLTTHQMAEAEALADHVVIVDEGKSVAAGSLAALTGDATTVRVGLGPEVDAEASCAALRSALALDARFAGSTVRLSPEHHLEVDGPDAPALLAEITAWAHRGDVALTSVATARRSLEDVFLDLTGRSLR